MNDYRGQADQSPETLNHQWARGRLGLSIVYVEDDYLIQMNINV